MEYNSYSDWAQSKVHWVIQSNLGSSGETERLVSAASEDGCVIHLIKVIPFSEELPDIPEDNVTIFYGACNFINNIYKSGKWRPATWHNNDAFSYDNYIARYGEQMLNSDARILTMAEFGQEKHNPNQLFFIRPIHDLKAFAGELMEFGNFSIWYDGISHGGCTIEKSCPILVAEPKNISEEFRLFIVEGKVVAASRYRKDFRLDISPEVPSDVLLYGEQQTKIYSPAPIFVMDVGITKSGFRIIELGSFNSAGLYGANEANIVKAINSYVKSEH